MGVQQSRVSNNSAIIEGEDDRHSEHDASESHDEPEPLDWNDVDAVRQRLFDDVQTDDFQRFQAVLSRFQETGTTQADVAGGISLCDARILNDKQESLLCYALSNEKLNIARYLIETQDDAKFLLYSYHIQPLHVWLSFLGVWSY